MLFRSIQDPDPVIFLEPKRIYHLVKQEVVDDGKPMPLDHPFILRQGEDITFITWGASVTEALAAADVLAGEGCRVEVIDVATLSPLNEEPILASVEKTGRCVIIHEAAYTGGYGAEIAARLAERGLMSLLAPVARVTGYDTVVPMPRLEHYAMVTTDRIVAEARRLMDYS